MPIATSVRPVLSAFASCFLSVSVFAQQSATTSKPGSDFPEGPGKQQVMDTCNGCHDINRIKAGYTPEGWVTIMAMKLNAGAPLQAEDWPTVLAYLIKTFPERPR